MSLLIKALAMAEKDKQAELNKRGSADLVADSATLVLAPVEAAPALEFKLADEADFSASPDNKADGISAGSQKVAASVFVANQSVKNPSSKSALVLLGAAGALMIWLGLHGYQYIASLTAPALVIIKSAPPMSASSVVTSADESKTLEAQNAGAGQDAVVEAIETPKKEVVKAATPNAEEPKFETSSSLFVEGSATAKKLSAKKQIAEGRASGSAYTEAENPDTLRGAAQRQPLKLVSKTPIAGVDPTLLAAYQAFGRGEDAAAQQQYRQVLQRDVRNVDALLGMAAIAQRQSRDADAMGWYQRVLEIEPRNTIAQSAMTNVQMQANLASQDSASIDLMGTESRIKSMLAQQPESANLHAALGNLFVAQNQWAAAQEAYFNASHFAPNSADYAFNLAISLDHLGKPGLALAQYRRALDLLNKTAAISPDRAQLEARIQALQASK